VASGTPLNRQTPFPHCPLVDTGRKGSRLRQTVPSGTALSETLRTVILGDTSTHRPFTMHFCLHPAESLPHPTSPSERQTEVQNPPREHMSLPPLHVLATATSPDAEQHSGELTISFPTLTNPRSWGRLMAKEVEHSTNGEVRRHWMHAPHESDWSRHSHCSSGPSTPSPHMIGVVPFRPDVEFPAVATTASCGQEFAFARERKVQSSSRFLG